MSPFDDAVGRTCLCVPVDELGVRITTGCPLHNPFERIARGEHVEFVGLAGVVGVVPASSPPEIAESPEIGRNR